MPIIKYHEEQDCQNVLVSPYLENAGVLKEYKCSPSKIDLHNPDNSIDLLKIHQHCSEVPSDYVPDCPTIIGITERDSLYGNHFPSEGYKAVSIQGNTRIVMEDKMEVNCTLRPGFVIEQGQNLNSIDNMFNLKPDNCTAINHNEEWHALTQDKVYICQNVDKYTMEDAVSKSDRLDKLFNHSCRRIENIQDFPPMSTGSNVLIADNDRQIMFTNVGPGTLEYKTFDHEGAVNSGVLRNSICPQELKEVYDHTNNEAQNIISYNISSHASSSNSSTNLMDPDFGRCINSSPWERSNFSDNVTLTDNENSTSMFNFNDSAIESDPDPLWLLGVIGGLSLVCLCLFLIYSCYKYHHTSKYTPTPTSDPAPHDMELGEMATDRTGEVEDSASSSHCFG